MDNTLSDLFYMSNEQEQFIDDLIDAICDVKYLSDDPADIELQKLFSQE